MCPILFDIEGFQIYAYGTVMVVAALVGGVWAWRSRPAGLFLLEQYLGLCLVTVLGASVGARLAFLVQHGDLGAANLGLILRTWERGGLASIGVPVVVAPLLWAYCAGRRLAFVPVLDHLLPFAILGAGLQRLFGCFAAGCCSGVATDMPWAVRFPGTDAWVHPTQLYLGMALLLSFALLRSLRFNRQGSSTLLSLACFAFASLVVGAFRAESPALAAEWGALRVDLCYGLLLVGAALSWAVRGLWSRRGSGLLVRSSRGARQSLLGLVWGIAFVGATTQPVEAALTVKLDCDDVVWGEPVSVEVAATSPVLETRQGGITVSFSAPVLVLSASDGATVFHPGDEIYGVGHRSTRPAHEVMVERWYRAWPARATRSLRLTFVPLSDGVLHLRARAAVIRSLAARDVVNDPASSACRDQQGYPAICRHVFVKTTAFWHERVQRALRQVLSREATFLRRLHGLLSATSGPATLGDWATSRGGADLTRAFEAFRVRLMDPEIRDSSRLGDFLQRILEDPLDRDALRFFKLLHETPPDDPIARYASQCKTYLAALRGGGNLLSLLAAEGDFRFGFTTDPQLVVLGYGSRRLRFSKGPFIVREIIEKILEIKPHSRFVTEKEPISGTSYWDLLQVLGKSS